MNTGSRVILVLVLALALPLAWSVILIAAPQVLPAWMIPLDWWTYYMLPVLLLGAGAIIYLKPRFVSIPIGLAYIPLMYLWTLGIGLGVCAEFFGGCK